MAGSVLLKGSICLVFVLLITNVVLARDKGSKKKSSREKCKQDLANCMNGGIACQGGGYNVHCIPFNRLCNGIPDCEWGEDEIYCAPPVRPTPTRFSTRTVVRTTVTTTTSTTTSTRTSTTTSTLTSTSVTSTTSHTSTTHTPTFSLWPSSSWATSVVVTTLPPYMAAERLIAGQMVAAGGQTCSLQSVAAMAMAGNNDYRVVSSSSSFTITGAATAVCTAATTTIF